MFFNFIFFYFILFHQNVWLKKFETDVIFGGDVSFDAPIWLENGSACPYSHIFKHMSRYFANADYNMVNLESPFILKQNKNSPRIPNKGVNNKAWPESVKALAYAGIKSVSLANNHISDFGEESVNMTTQILLKNKIEFIGLTYGKAQPYSHQKPLIKELNGIKVGFLGYCGDYSGECEFYRAGFNTSTALLLKSTVKYDLEKLKGKVDFIVTFLHWGSEYNAIPTESQRKMAIYLSRLGVNLIVGAHPHVLQGHEWLNNTLVHYSLGNFVYHGHYTIMDTLTGSKSNKKKLHLKANELSRLSKSSTTSTELLKVKITKTGIKSAYFLPVRIFGDKNGCIQPKPKVEDNWIEVCGPQDENCYASRPGN